MHSGPAALPAADRKRPAGRRTTGLATVLLALGFALLSAAGALAVFTESGPALLPLRPVEERFALLAEGKLAPAASELSRALLLEECLRLSESVFGRVQPSGRRTRLLEGCGLAAEQAVRQVPTHGLGHLVLAYAAAERGDGPALSEALTASRRYSPNAVWLAKGRARLAITHEILLDTNAQSALGGDLAVLAASPDEQGTLAQLYLSDPTFRERLRAVLKTLSRDDQQRFVGALRDASLAARAP